MTAEAAHQTGPPSRDEARRGVRVALFTTCANDVMFPDTPKAVVSLLERLG